MTCEYADRDGAYVLGALSPAERLEFEHHLAGCEECEQDRRREDGSPQNCTRGASRTSASSTSKYSRGSKLKIPATMLVGTVSSALS